MLEDAQKQARRSGRTIADEKILIFASTVMLTMEIFPRTNDDWEDCAKADKTWAEWMVAYKKVHAKARVKSQANEGSVKFAAANSAAILETTQGA